MDVLLVDKTGTLTENKQQLKTILPIKGLTKNKLLAWIVAASDASGQDSISQAIQQAAKTQPEANLKVQQFTPFNGVTQLTQAVIDEDGERSQLYFGAPAAVAKALHLQTALSPEANQLALQGQRVLALGKITDKKAQIVGWASFSDTLRPNITDQIKDLQQTGVHVVMLTGDNQITAKAIAQQVGLSGAIIAGTQTKVDLETVGGFANVLPQDKQTIVQAFQNRGHTVGMIGDGVNDAIALRQADVGLAVADARDIAKRSARLILANTGLTDVMTVLNSGRRVYQRMMTWTITKLSRTALLTALLTLGFIFTGSFPISLNLMVLIAILNDIVTLVLGTDNTEQLDYVPKWQLPAVVKLASRLAIGWLIVGLLLVFANVFFWHQSATWFGTVAFMYLMLSSMMTIAMTRTTKFWWQSRPSSAVLWAIGFDVVFVIVLALSGFLTAAVGFKTILGVILLILGVGTLLDFSKRRFYKTQWFK